MNFVYRTLFVAAATLLASAAVTWFVYADHVWLWAASFGANWFVMAWIAALVRSTGFQLSTGYYHPRTFEKGRLYPRLGVPRFGRLIRRGPLHLCAPGLECHARRAELAGLEQQMRGAEAVHVLAFLASLGLPVYSLVRGRPTAAAWALLFNAAINVYPVMLQRYNRLRIAKLLR
jgi:hypothetical protein